MQKPYNFAKTVGDTFSMQMISGREIRVLVAEGRAGQLPPRRGRPSSIPEEEFNCNTDWSSLWFPTLVESQQEVSAAPENNMFDSINNDREVEPPQEADFSDGTGKTGVVISKSEEEPLINLVTQENATALVVVDYVTWEKVELVDEFKRRGLKGHSQKNNPELALRLSDVDQT
jgi:hypothetical protein